MSKEIGLLEEFFPIFSKIVGRLNLHHRYGAFSELINAIKNTAFFRKEKNHINTQFIVLLSGLDEVYNHFHKYDYFLELVNAIKDTDLVNEQKLRIENQLRYLSNSRDKLFDHSKVDASEILRKIRILLNI